MWAEEADKYWKKADVQRAKKRQFKVILPACTLMFAVLSVCISVLWPLPHTAGGKSSLVTPASAPLTAKERMLALSTDDRLSCQSEGLRLVDEGCSEQCSRERDTFPRPTIHRACQDSCRQAGERAVQAVCFSNEVTGCWDVATAECGPVCEDVLNKYPSARTFDVCRRHCRTMVKAACSHRTDWVKRAIRQSNNK